MMIKPRFLMEFKACKIPKPEKCKLGNLNSPVVYSVDKICKKLGNSSKTHCDEIVFYSIKKATGIYCIENKTGKDKNLDISEIKKQLQGGAEIVERRLTPLEEFQFMPLLVAPKTPRSWNFEQLKDENKVTCANQKKHIRHIQINKPLLSNQTRL